MGVSAKLSASVRLLATLLLCLLLGWSEADGGHHHQHDDAHGVPGGSLASYGAGHIHHPPQGSSSSGSGNGITSQYGAHHDYLLHSNRKPFYSSFAKEKPTYGRRPYKTRPLPRYRPVMYYKDKMEYLGNPEHVKYNARVFANKVANFINSLPEPPAIPDLPTGAIEPAGNITKIGAVVGNEVVRTSLKLLDSSVPLVGGIAESLPGPGDQTDPAQIVGLLSAVGPVLASSGYNEFVEFTRRATARVECFRKCQGLPKGSPLRRSCEIQFCQEPEPITTTTTESSLDEYEYVYDEA